MPFGSADLMHANANSVMVSKDNKLAIYNPRPIAAGTYRHMHPVAANQGWQAAPSVKVSAQPCKLK